MIAATVVTPFALMQLSPDAGVSARDSARAAIGVAARQPAGGDVRLIEEVVTGVAAAATAGLAISTARVSSGVMVGGTAGVIVGEESSSGLMLACRIVTMRPFSSFSFFSLSTQLSSFISKSSSPAYSKEIARE